MNHRDKLEQLTGRKVSELKPIAGVYFLLREGELVYIGQSSNLHRRLIDRRYKPVTFDTMLYVEIQDASERLALEAKLIWELRPEGNYVNEQVRQLLESMQ